MNASFSAAKRPSECIVWSRPTAAISIAWNRMANPQPWLSKKNTKRQWRDDLQRQSAGEARLKIEQGDPVRRDRDSHHVRNHGSKLRHPRFALLAAEVALRSQCILRNNPIHGLQLRSAAHQQHLMRKAVVIDGERHLGVLRQGLDLRSF